MSIARQINWAAALTVLVTLAAAWFLPHYVGRYYTHMLALAGVTIIAGHGLNLLVGYTGQVSLGHAGFYAIGAYTAALLATKAGLGFWATIPVALVLSAIAGVLIAIPSFKLEGPYLSMVTIAFGIIVHSALIEWDGLTGGTQGVLNIPRISWFGQKLPLERQFFVIATAVLLITLLMRNLTRSPWGRNLVAVRSNPIAAQAVGLDTAFVKTIAFTLSAAIAGLAGVLFAFLQGFISPEAFDFDQSIFFLTGVMFGGAGLTAGPIAGGLLTTFLPELLQEFADYRLIVYGLMIVLSLYFLPHGLMGIVTRWRPVGAAQRGGRALEVAKAFEVRPPPSSRGPVISLRNVQMAFGGVRALNGVGFDVHPGEVAAVIGPNGAGKTVLLNVLCGYYAPTEGEIRLQGRRIDGASPQRIARAGVARTFQTAQLFSELSVLDNVRLGFAPRSDKLLFDCLVASPRMARKDHEMRADAESLLQFVGYAGDPNAPAASLPLGHQRLVEIARALASNPLLVVMDEPAAGLNPTEVNELKTLIRKIGDHGIAVLLVEHHMDLVMELSRRIVVLDYGVKIAEGEPDLIRKNPEVVAAYLGSEEGAHQD